MNIAQNDEYEYRKLDTLYGLLIQCVSCAHNLHHHNSSSEYAEILTMTDAAKYLIEREFERVGLEIKTKLLE